MGKKKAVHRIGVAVSSFGFLLPTLGWASEDVGTEQISARTTEDIIVTATRSPLPDSALPATIQIITAQQTRVQSQIGGSAIDAVSALVPSFSPTRQKMSGAGETLRGRSPLFLIDGVPQSTPLRDGSRDGFTIDPFFIDRMEVIFGSNAIQGVGAAGGVINYVTAKPALDQDRWSGAILAQATASADFDSDGMGGKIAARFGRDFGSVDLVVGTAYEERGAFYDGDGRRVGVDGTQGELQDSTSWSGFLKAGWDISDTRRIEAMLNRFELSGDNGFVVVAGNRANGLPTTSTPGQQDGVPPINTAWTGYITYRDSALWGGVMTAQVFATDFESVFGGGLFVDFQDPRISAAPNLFDQSSNLSDKLGFKVDWSGPVSAVPGLQLTLGLDGLQDKTFQELIATGRKWVPDVTYSGLGPFVQLNQALMDDRLNLSFGARRESATLDVPSFETLYFYGPQSVDGGKPKFEETLTNYGAVFEVVDGFTLYGSYAQGFTLADVGRILRAINKPNQDVDTFLDVSPVVSDNVEFGVELDSGPIKASLAHFTSNSDRGSLLVLRAGDVYEVQRQRTEISGFDFSLRARTPFEGLDLSIAASSLLGKSDNNGDGQVETDLTGPNIAPDRVLVALDYARGPLTLRLQHQDYVARRFVGGDPRNDFEGYQLLDAYLRYETSFGAIALSASNLLDTQYISYNSDTERPTDNLRYFAGRGRALTLSFERRF